MGYRFELLEPGQDPRKEHNPLPRPRWTWIIVAGLALASLGACLGLVVPRVMAGRAQDQVEPALPITPTAPAFALGRESDETDPETTPTPPYILATEAPLEEPQEPLVITQIVEVPVEVVRHVGGGVREVPVEVIKEVEVIREVEVEVPYPVPYEVVVTQLVPHEILVTQLIPIEVTRLVIVTATPTYTPTPTQTPTPESEEEPPAPPPEATHTPAPTVTATPRPESTATATATLESTP